MADNADPGLDKKTSIDQGDEGAANSSTAATTRSTVTTATQALPAALTPEQKKVYTDKLDEFRKILTELVEGARDRTPTKPGSTGTPTEPGSTGIPTEPGSTGIPTEPGSTGIPTEPGSTGTPTKPGSASTPTETGSTRNPIALLIRYFNRVPEFEDLIAKYTNILPTLDTDDGLPYCEMALNGIKALRRRKLEIAKAVYFEVLFKTTPSANLGSTLLGVCVSISCLVALSAALAAILRWLGFNLNKIQPESETEAIHLVIAFCFGCFGSVVSFLGRLSEFDSKQVRSRRFLFTYGFTLPIVGGGFAVVLAAALDAKIITIFQNSVQLFMVIGFLAGFSERFTKTILNMAENKLFPQKAPEVIQK
jgi:hypothetical protein